MISRRCGIRSCRLSCWCCRVSLRQGRGGQAAAPTRSVPARRGRCRLSDRFGVAGQGGRQDLPHGGAGESRRWRDPDPFTEPAPSPRDDGHGRSRASSSCAARSSARKPSPWCGASPVSWPTWPRRRCETRTRSCVTRAGPPADDEPAASCRGRAGQYPATHPPGGRADPDPSGRPGARRRGPAGQPARPGCPADPQGPSGQADRVRLQGPNRRRRRRRRPRPQRGDRQPTRRAATASKQPRAGTCTPNTTLSSVSVPMLSWAV